MNEFTMKSWTEEIVSGPEDGPRYAYAHATFDYGGIIEGQSSCDYLLYYAGPDYDGGGVPCTGLERVEGTVHDKKGSFVMRHEVNFEGHRVSGTWTVAPGSGTGELAGLTGGGTISGSSETMAYTFDAQFEQE